MRTYLLKVLVEDEVTPDIIEKGCVLEWGGSKWWEVKVMGELK